MSDGSDTTSTPWGSLAAGDISTAVSTVAEAARSIAVPTNTQVGDTLVLVAANGFPKAFNAPTGGGSASVAWTSLYSTTTGDIAPYVWIRTALAADIGASITVTRTGSGNTTISMVMIRLPGAVLTPRDLKASVNAAMTGASSPTPTAVGVLGIDYTLEIYTATPNNSTGAFTFNHPAAATYPTWTQLAKVQAAVSGQYNAGIAVLGKRTGGLAGDLPIATATASNQNFSWAVIALALAPVRSGLLIA